MNSILNDDQLIGTLARVEWFLRQTQYLRNTEMNVANYHAAAKGFITEIDRMQLEVREYLSLHPTELKDAA